MTTNHDGAQTAIGADRLNAAFQPSRIAIPQADLDDLRVVLAGARWPDEAVGAG